MAAIFAVTATEILLQNEYYELSILNSKWLDANCFQTTLSETNAFQNVPKIAKWTLAKRCRLGRREEPPPTPGTQRRRLRIRVSDFESVSGERERERVYRSSWFAKTRVSRRPARGQRSSESTAPPACSSTCKNSIDLHFVSYDVSTGTFQVDSIRVHTIADLKRVLERRVVFFINTLQQRTNNEPASREPKTPVYTHAPNTTYRILHRIAYYPRRVETPRRRVALLRREVAGLRLSRGSIRVFRESTTDLGCFTKPNLPRSMGPTI